MKNLRLLQARTEKQITQKEMAAAVGLSIRGYQKLETEGISPTLQTAFHIADVLGVQDLRELWNVEAIQG